MEGLIDAVTLELLMQDDAELIAVDVVHAMAEKEKR